MKTYHVLNGDALLEQFPTSLSGEIIVLRECLVEGPVDATNDEEFYRVRAEFLASSYGVSHEDYLTQTRAELKKLDRIEEGAEVNFWFEDDLFCQVNFWFALHRTSRVKMVRFLVRPVQLTAFGFAAYDEAGLQDLFRKRIAIPTQLPFNDLWEPYTKDKSETLQHIASQLEKFPFIMNAVVAHLQRQPHSGYIGRPSEILLEIKEELATEQFGPIFREFTQRAPIYGFGDIQVKRLLDQL